MASGAYQKPRFITAVASAAYTITASTAAFALPGLADSYMLFGVHTSVSGTTPTFDWIVSTSVDGGTTYINLPLRSTQVTAAGSTMFLFKLGLGGNEVAIESPVATTGGTLAKNCIFDPAFMKLNVVVGGSTPTSTTVWYAAAISKGTMGQSG